MSDTESFDQVVLRMATQPTAWTPDDYGIAFSVIKRFVLSRFNVRDFEADEIVSDVMIKFFQMNADGSIDADRNPGSYLRRAAQWAALDHIRRNKRFESREYATTAAELPEGNDNNVARAIDAAATAELVRKALGRLRENGDQTAYRVIIEFLNASELGDARPSNRTVARTLGVSHTAVAQAVLRFSNTLQKVTHETTDE